MTTTSGAYLNSLGFLPRVVATSHWVQLLEEGLAGNRLLATIRRVSAVHRSAVSGDRA